MFNLRKYIKQILLEDAVTFEKELKTKNLGTPPQWNDENQYDDSTMKQQHQWGRVIKDLFRKHADHDFFKTLSLVHWVSYPQHLQNLKNKNKDEISCTMTLPNKGEFSHTYGAEVGLLVKGHVTLAANSQDNLYTGYKSDYHPPRRQDTGEVVSGASLSKMWSKKDVEDYKHKSASSGVSKYPKEYAFFGKNEA